MCNFMELDVDCVARIGLLYIDGDKLEDVLIDKVSTSTDDITYNHEYFNELKISLLKLEKINPELNLTAVLWQSRPNNINYGMPVVAGNALPFEGPDFPAINEEIKCVLRTGVSQKLKRPDGAASHYYPVKNSNSVIVGVLELISNYKNKFEI